MTRPTDIKPLVSNEPDIVDEPDRLCITERSLLGQKPPLEGVRCVAFGDADSPLNIVNTSNSGLTLCVILCTRQTLQDKAKEIWEWVKIQPLREVKIIVLSSEKIDRNAFEPVPSEFVHLILPEKVPDQSLQTAVQNAFFQMKIRYEKLRLQSRLAVSTQEMRRIIKVGQALSTERDFDTLLEMILTQARELVAADSGSIYVTEPNKDGPPAQLRFKKSSLQLRKVSEFLLPINSKSIAGHVAVTGEPLLIEDVYNLDESLPYRFNFEYDQMHDYYTRSMLIIPMKNHRDDIIGVIQLINKRPSFHRKLTFEEMKNGNVLIFENRDLEMVSALAGQAAVAIENNKLVDDINNLFEGFVKASVTAIEQRDPTTSGHSFRVAEYTTGLAKAIDRLSTGKYENLKFSHEQIREIRYASLLHDFGKVGVREQVLVKAKKLYDHQLEEIRWRFRYLKKALENEYLQKKILYMKENGKHGFDYYEKYLELEMNHRLQELMAMLTLIENSNEPAVMETDSVAQLEQIANHTIHLDDGKEVPFLKRNELVSLQVRRGNLDQTERQEIESHVSHTYRFLVQIPWTPDLRQVPDIAHAHHEKLDGSGYPLRLMSQDISPQSRMMTIADIYDALTAPDRPYKKSLSAENALDILHIEAKQSHLDPELLKVFIEAEIYKQIRPADYQQETESVVRLKN